jgi:hypothetical protein
VIHDSELQREREKERERERHERQNVKDIYIAAAICSTVYAQYT